MRMTPSGPRARPRPSSRSSRATSRLAGAFLIVLAAAGCASLPPAREPIPSEVKASLDLLDQRWRAFADLRTLAELTIRRGDRVQRFAGVLLLRAPASLRFEALSPFGTPVLIVAADPKTLTLWEVADDRAYFAPATGEANRRWLGVALGGQELVALLAGRVVPLSDPLRAERLSPDAAGPSLNLVGADGSQRIWFDPANGQARQVEWSGGKTPLRATFLSAKPDAPPGGVRLAAPDGSLDVRITYKNPRMNTGFDPALLTLTVPEGVRIQDFR
jgi:outer membrane lipoprotein-sorting protein